MPKPWSEVADSPEFSNLTINQQDAARQQYFNQVVAPRVPPDMVQAAQSQFDSQTKDTGVDDLVQAITHVESGGNSDATSPQGARGSMQIMPATFSQYAKPGESYDNDDHRRAAAIRKLQDDYNYYGGDRAQTAAAYIGGRGAVHDDGSIRDDVADSLGTTPADYADRVMARIEANQNNRPAPALTGVPFTPQMSVPPAVLASKLASTPDQSPEETARLANVPDTTPSTFATVAGNAIGGLMGTISGATAAGYNALGFPEKAAEWDQVKKAISDRQQDLGGGTFLGKASNMVGSIIPALGAPAERAAEWAKNAGLFAIPAFRDTLNSQLDQGHSYPVAMAHAAAAFGINMVLPSLATKGSGAVTKLLGASEATGARAAAVGLGQAAGEGAGFSAANSIIDKGIDTVAGVQNDNPWIDPEDMAVNALSFGSLRAGHYLAPGISDAVMNKVDPKGQAARALSDSIDSTAANIDQTPSGFSPDRQAILNLSSNLDPRTTAAGYQPAAEGPAIAAPTTFGKAQARDVTSAADKLMAVRPLDEVKVTVDAAPDVDSAIAAAQSVANDAAPLDVGITPEQQQRTQEIQQVQGSDALQQHLDAIHPAEADAVRGAMQDSIDPTIPADIREAHNDALHDHLAREGVFDQHEQNQAMPQGREITLPTGDTARALDRDSLPIDSPASAGVTKGMADVFAAHDALFGTKTAIVDRLPDGSDGMVRGKSGELFVSANSKINPLDVFSHEVSHVVDHVLGGDSDAITARDQAIRDNLTDDSKAKYVLYYNDPSSRSAVDSILTSEQAAQRSRSGSRDITFTPKQTKQLAGLFDKTVNHTQELAADLRAHAMKESSYWSTFRDALTQHVGEDRANTIFSRLADGFKAVLDKYQSLYNERPSFAVRELVTNHQRIYDAIAKADAEFAAKRTEQPAAQPAEQPAEAQAKVDAKPKLTAAEKRQAVLESLLKMTNGELRAVAENHARVYVKDRAAEILQDRANTASMNRSALAKNRSAQAQRIDPDVDSMASAIAKLQGINRDSASGRLQLSPEELNARGMVGNLSRPLFHRFGMPMDRMGAALAELGYVHTDEHGKHDQADFEDKLGDVANGIDVYTPNAIMRRAQESHEHAMAEVGAHDDEQYDRAEHLVDSAPDQIQANVDRLFDANDIQGRFTNEQIDRLFEPADSGISEEHTDRGPQGRDSGDQAPAEGSGEKRYELNGESHSEGEARLKAEQARYDAEDAADREYERQAQAEENRKEIAARQDSSAENFKLGESAEDSLSGQDPLFSHERDTDLGRNLADHDAIFRLPKSNKDTVEGITADNDAQIQVRKVTDIPGEIRYNFTLPDGNTARMMVRPDNPYGHSVYDIEMRDGDMHADTERPGKNREHVEGKDDVWIDVSLLDQGTGFGAKIYNIAATYAHNTGKVFIGDPHGLSDQALRRRPEQMLSSALKFGTTDHLAPHARQVRGDEHLGVPRLDWTYGDHEGNVRKLLEVNRDTIENNGGNGGIVYNKETGSFEDGHGNAISRDDIDGMAKAGLGRASNAGGSTLARHALFDSLLQERGKPLLGPDGLLAKISEQQRRADSAGVDSPVGDILYSPNRESTWHYSQLSRSIEQAPDRVFGAPKQFAAWLDANAGKLGIKKDEMQWSGVTDWLKLQTGKVSKADVMDYLRRGGVQITETVKNAGGRELKFNETSPGQWDAGNSMRIEKVTPGNIRQIRNGSGHEDANVGDYATFTAGGSYLLADNFNDAKMYLNEAHQEGGGKTLGETKYDSYQLPGGTNYRELLLTLPKFNETRQQKIDAVNDKYNAIMDTHGVPVQDLPANARAEIDRLTQQHNNIADAPDERDYQSSHWDEPNILAHVRFNDRTDADGKKVLFIEELQSDWGQAGLKGGFNKPADVQITEKSVTPNPYAPDGKQYSVTVDGEDFGTFNTREEAQARADGAPKSGGVVPDAPFVTKTEGWLQLGIKRMISYAAENGYDKMAFVNGEQSAGRYDLSKQIDKLEHAKNDDGTYAFATHKDGKRLFAKTDATPHDLENHLGKELAKKVIEGGDGGVLNGLDIKVGGEGMKAFYDKIVPQNVNEVLKKLGSGKVGEVRLRDSDFDTKQSRADDDLLANLGVEVKGERPPSQPGFDITPEMKTKAADGLPLFSRGREKENANRDAKSGGDALPDRSRIDDLKEAASTKLSSVLKTPKQLLTDLKVSTLPMGTGSEVAKKVATDFADQGRRASWQWNKFDEILRKDFTPEQQEKMWVAADQENDLLREGRTSETEGLNSLNPEERKVVETLHTYGEALWQRATEAGMVETSGVHYWTPRTAALISDTGEVAPMPSKGGGVGKDGRNLSTTSANTKHRSYDTTAEAEAAGKAAYGEDFQFVKNIRTMPMAMGKLERAIAGRELVNQIKAIGQASGTETVANGERPNFFTMDHPSLKKWGPEFTDDGKVRLDENGDPVMVSKPIYISRDFEGPLKAVLTRTHAMTDVYNGIMELKSKSMGLIMMSPMIHNAVEYGRAVPAMLTSDAATTGKNILTLGAYTYIAGNRAKNNPEIMRDAIEHGLVPIGGRGQMVDIKGIADPASMEIGKSWTAKALAAGVGLVAGERGATATKKAVDAAGRFWHETLLWNRVADLQMGLYTTMRTSLINKGASEYEASVAAAHFANRYAGALPAESMSQGAREILNLALFSRSFTAGNIGAMKDMFAGLPANRQAQIRMRAIEVAKALGKSDVDAEASAGKSLDMVQSMARRKAVAAFVLDVGLMYMANSLMQDWLQREKLSGWAGWRQSYADRKDALWNKVSSDPTALLLHPFNSIQSLTSTGDNPEGKEERIKWGEDSAGNSIYMRLPFGKIGEEFLNYTTPGGVIKQIHNKLSPMVKPLVETYNNDKGFGKKVYDDSADSNVFKQAGQIAANFMKAQVPYDMGQAAYDLARGKGDDMDKKKLVGPFVGLTFSKLTGGDAVAEQFKAAKDLQDRKMAVMDDVHRAIKYGDEDKAYKLLEGASLTPKEINSTINRIENPRGMPTAAQMRKFNQHATEDQKAKMEKLR